MTRGENKLNDNCVARHLFSAICAGYVLFVAGCNAKAIEGGSGATDIGLASSDESLNTRQQAIEVQLDGSSIEVSADPGLLSVTTYDGAHVDSSQSYQQDEPAHAVREESARLARERQVYERQELARDFFYRIPDDVEGMVGEMPFVVTPDETMALEEANSRRVAATPPADARERVRLDGSSLGIAQMRLPNRKSARITRTCDR